MTTCDRCRGNKVFTHFKHIEAGICFKCGGTGVMMESAATPVIPTTHSPIYFCHTLVDGEVEHVFQRDVSGNIRYWVNNDSTQESSAHQTFDTVEELRTKYSAVRSSL